MEARLVVTSAKDLLTALPLPAILLDANGRVQATNPSAEGLVGRGAIGRHYVSVLRRPRLLDAVEEALHGRSADASHASQEAGRDTSWFMMARPLPSGGALLVFEDRTRDGEVGQVRRDFVANVSHELKTPITAILGYVETLRGPAKDDPPARARFLDSMAREAARMSRLVSDLLSLSRVEAEQRVRPTHSVDLVPLVARTIQRVTERHDLAPALLGVDMPESVRVPGDPDQIEQIVSNLLENALRYAPGSPVHVVLEDAIPISATSGGGRPFVRLSIRDEGPGIEAHHVPRLTERFYRVDGHRSREKGGTGLGLAIVKHVVARHRGRLSIESEPGKGTEVIVLLPPA